MRESSVYGGRGDRNEARCIFTSIGPMSKSPHLHVLEIPAFQKSGAEV